MSQEGCNEQQRHTTDTLTGDGSQLHGTRVCNPEANQEVLGALFGIAEILDTHDEEDLTQGDRDAMAAVCGKIRDALIDRFPTCKHFVPEPEPYAIGLTCHAVVSIGLGLVPQPLREPLLKFCEDSDEGKFPRLSSLQNGPLDVRDLAGTLERNSPLEWFSMNAGVQGPLLGVSQREFLRQLLRIARLAVDDTGRHEEAVSYLTATHARFSTMQETGPNLPVMGYCDRQRNAVGLDVIDTPASYFDHALQAYFSNEIKKWLLFRLDGKPLFIPGDTATTVRLQAGKGSQYDSEAYAFSSAGELAKAVKKLQSGSDIRFIPVHSRREPIAASLLPAYFGNGREHEFWGARMKEPIVLRGVQERDIILNSLGPGVRPDEKVLRWKIVDVPGAPTGRGIRFAISKPSSQVSSATFKDLSQPRTHPRTLKMRSLFFDDLHTLHLLEKPLPLSRPEELWQPAYDHRGKRAHLYGFQSFTSDGLLYPIFKEPEVTISGRDFGNRKLVFTYGSVGKLTVGRPINRLPMAFTHLPVLDSLGFYKDGSGNNALTNHWDLCIPLHKPTAKRFQHPLLRPIQALQSVSEKDWPLLVSSLQGDWVSSISDVADRLRSRESAAHGEVLTSPGLPNAPKLGDFYKAPRESVDIYPPWIISNCEINGCKFYVVDSPLYGDALYLYRSRDGARRAAEHLARHGRRGAVRDFSGFIQRIIHREGWRGRLTEAVYEHILGQRMSADAKELGA